MYQAIASNKRKTFFIMALFLAIILAVAWLASYLLGWNAPVFTLIALVVATVYAFIQYFAAARIALAVNGAREIQKADDPRYYRIVENLAITAGLPMPKVYIMEDPALNAFATGRDPNHAVVCATTGLLQTMTDTELQAVMAHELGHVQNYDIRVMMITFGLVSAIGLLTDLIIHAIWFGGGDGDDAPSPIFMILGIIAIVLAPFIATLVQLAVSRRREYLADSSGVMLTRYPEGLASALEKIKNSTSVTRRQNSSSAHLFFANPLKKNFFNNLLSTHPPVEDRIARLRGMGL